MKVFLILIIACLGFIGNSHSKVKPSVIYLDSPREIIQQVPPLRNVHYKEKRWEKRLNIPSLGTKQIKLTYFEFNITPKEIMGDDGHFAITLVTPKAPRDLHIAVATQRGPDEATLANEAVNALLPEWLISRGVDMFEVYKKPMGGYWFQYQGRQWSFDQLTELLSWIVPGQTLPGGYLSSQTARVCEGNPSPKIKGHDVYALIHFMINKFGCNLPILHDKSGEVLTAFISSAPKL